MGHRFAPPFECLVAALQDPERYPHPVQRVDTLETHASVVLLAGEFAYKLKKPVSLGFLDYTSLDARRFFCSEELRLNKRTAPHLYLDVVALTGSPDLPEIYGSGEPIEFAVRMRRFAQESLLDTMARDGTLGTTAINTLARLLVQFHAAIAIPAVGHSFGTSERILAAAADNFAALRAFGRGGTELAALEAWTRREHSLDCATFERRMGGFVRECHGDLHLGNIALIEGQPTPFDGIEYSEELRWIDVMNEIAFLHMDLRAHGLAGLAHVLLSEYLDGTGDYEGLALLRFYAVYRALVRAKVAAIRAGQFACAQAEESSRRGDTCARHIELARVIAGEFRSALVIMHGVSGSGKTTVSSKLVEDLCMVRCRSDRERKRLLGLPVEARTASGLRAGLYSEVHSKQTYERLADIARSAISAGFPVIVDAAFLRRTDRQRFKAIAAQLGVPFAIVSCAAPDPLLRFRLGVREAARTDASEANHVVLERQRRTLDPLSDEERGFAVEIDTSSIRSQMVDAVQSLKRKLKSTTPEAQPILC